MSLAVAFVAVSGPCRISLSPLEAKAHLTFTSTNIQTKSREIGTYPKRLPRYRLLFWKVNIGKALTAMHT